MLKTSFIPFLFSSALLLGCVETIQQPTATATQNRPLPNISNCSYLAAIENSPQSECLQREARERQEAAVLVNQISQRHYDNCIRYFAPPEGESDFYKVGFNSFLDCLKNKDAETWFANG